MALSTLNMATDQKKDDITFYIQEKAKGSVECEALLRYKSICSCKVNFNAEEKIWTIASWFTNEDMQGQGIGKETLANVLLLLYQKNGTPEEIKYIWNGMNSYVLEWMERHFDAKCSCPIAVQKKMPDDDWESHIYNLNVKKTLEYFGIVKR